MSTGMMLSTVQQSFGWLHRNTSRNSPGNINHFFLLTTPSVFDSPTLFFEVETSIGEVSLPPIGDPFDAALNLTDIFSSGSRARHMDSLHNDFALGDGSDDSLTESSLEYLNDVSQSRRFLGFVFSTRHDY